MREELEVLFRSFLTRCTQFPGLFIQFLLRGIAGAVTPFAILVARPSISKDSNKQDTGGGKFVDEMVRISLTDWQILTRTVECEVGPDYIFIGSFEHLALTVVRLHLRP